MASLSNLIAYKYIRSKKSVQAINIISKISVGAVTILSAAMIVLLSVFNGFESLLKDLYKAFYPPIKITATSGKWLDITEEQVQSITLIEGIESLSRSAEDMALIFKDDVQKVVILKGIEESWFEVTQFDSFVIDGNNTFKYQPAEIHPAIVGLGIANELGINVNSPISGMDIYYPKEDMEDVQIETSLNNKLFNGIGVFSCQSEFDSRYILTTLSSAQQLFDNINKLTSLELSLKPNASESKIRSQLQSILGTEKFLIQNQYEQNKTLYMVMNLEKLVIYVILTFVLILGSFTLVGVLSMMAIEKKKDMSLLKAIGAPDRLIFNIFMKQGLIISLIGGILGIIIGSLICFGQQYFGWIKMEPGFIIENYPVQINPVDVLLVLLIVMLVGALAAYIPAKKAMKNPIQFRAE